MFRRNGVCYCQDNKTGQQNSMHTSDRHEATRLLNAKNESVHAGAINLQIYMNAADPLMTSRTWGDVIEFMIDQHSNYHADVPVPDGDPKRISARTSNKEAAKVIGA